MGITAVELCDPQQHTVSNSLFHVTSHVTSADRDARWVGVIAELWLAGENLCIRRRICCSATLTTTIKVVGSNTTVAFDLKIRLMNVTTSHLQTEVGQTPETSCVPRVIPVGKPWQGKWCLVYILGIRRQRAPLSTYGITTSVFYF